MKIKNVIIAGTLLISIANFAQKDEIKVLKKINSKDNISPADIETYKASSAKLSLVASTDSDINAATFYKAILPKVEIAALGTTPTQAQINDILTSKKVIDFTAGIVQTLDFEKKAGRKIFTDEISVFIPQLKPLFVNYEVALGDQKKFKESSQVLYCVYKLDLKDPEKLYLKIIS